MALTRLYLVLSLVLCLSVFAHAWYDGDACCAIAKSEDKFLDISPQDAVCGQSYHLLSNGTPVAPAPDAYVSYSFCRTQCPGWGRSKANAPTQWAAPIVQFLLPSVIFALATPRAGEMETRHSWLYTKVIVGVHALLYWSLAWIYEPFADLVSWTVKAILAELVGFLLVAIDTVVWILAIIILAGPMLIEGLFEALLDFRIIRFVQSHPFQRDGAADCPRTQLLLTVVSGNLTLDIAEPQRKILAALDRTDVPQPTVREAAVQTRLLSMMGSQSIFGAAVGAPVLFYLGAFFYTILDLGNSPSSQDAAMSLAFGIEWMIVVHVAIVAGCLLANNNPSTSSAIVGLLPQEVGHTKRTNSKDAHLRPGDPGTAHNGSEPQMHQEPSEISIIPTFAMVGWHGCVTCLKKLTGWSEAYETVFQPVPMWRRGSNKMKWLRETQAWKTCPDGQGIKKSVGVLKWYWLFLPTFVFVMLPPIAGSVVAYATPPAGFGCRSLSFVCYAGCQFVLAVHATMELDAHSGSLWPWLRWLSKPWEWIVCFARLVLTIITWLLDHLPKFIRSFLGFLLIWLPFTAIPIVGSLFTAVGGTLMQVIGVYRTCFCYINSQWWNHLDTSPGVNLASDTEAARVSSQYWYQAGIVATGFMAVVCYLGWAYQESMRHLFREEVKRLYIDVSGNRNRSDGRHGMELREGAGREVGAVRSPSAVLLPLLATNTTVERR